MFKPLALLGVVAVIIAIYFSDVLYSFQYILNSNESGSNTLYTYQELAFYDGIHTPLLYLAILGTVFNVTKGVKHYGIDQQYHFFVGKDASRNFINGHFEEGSESDDVRGLTQQELRSLSNWLKFYRKEYTKVGKLVGRYYEKSGKLTPYGREIKRLIREAEQKEVSDYLEKQKFPPCNIEWNSKMGSRVWCSNKSGGIERKWIGKPRQYFEAGSKSFRCACISKENEILGSVKEYPGCDSESNSCFVQI